MEQRRVGTEQWTGPSFSGLAMETRISETVSEGAAVAALRHHHQPAEPDQEIHGALFLSKGFPRAICHSLDRKVHVLRFISLPR